MSDYQWYSSNQMTVNVKKLIKNYLCKRFRDIYIGKIDVNLCSGKLSYSTVILTNIYLNPLANCL